MKSRLALALTGTQLLMEMVRPATPAGIHGLLRSLPFVGRASPGNAPPQIVARAASFGVTSGLHARLEQAVSELKAQANGKFGGLDLEVQLGLDHARMGLMVLKDVAATELSNSTREAYAQAWVKQMFHLDPQTQVTRWQVLADPHKLLISCVDRLVFETLTEFALKHRLRFVSCRPAVLSAIGAQQGELTVVWTEAGADATRASSIQLLRFEGSQLSAAWRGWVPPSSNAAVADEALESAVRRFQAHTQAQTGAAVKRVHWPSIAQNASPIQ